MELSSKKGEWKHAGAVHSYDVAVNRTLVVFPGMVLAASRIRVDQNVAVLVGVPVGARLLAIGAPAAVACAPALSH